MGKIPGAASRHVATRKMTSSSILVLWRIGRFQVLSLSASFLPLGVSEATPDPIGSQGLSPFGWEKPTYNSCLLLSPQGPDFGKGLAALAVGTEFGGVNRYVFLCVSV